MDKKWVVLFRDIGGGYNNRPVRWEWQAKLYVLGLKIMAGVLHDGEPNVYYEKKTRQI